MTKFKREKINIKTEKNIKYYYFENIRFIDIHETEFNDLAGYYSKNPLEKYNLNKFLELITYYSCLYNEKTNSTFDKISDLSSDDFRNLKTIIPEYLVIRLLDRCYTDII